VPENSQESGDEILFCFVIALGYALMAKEARMDMQAQLLTVRRAAERLSIAERTARQWIAAGRLPVVRLARRCVRVPAEAVERLARGEQPDQGPGVDHAGRSTPKPKSYSQGAATSCGLRARS
jgi:excisionase family DNA binding protein